MLIGLDIGGTKIEGVAFSLENEQVLHRVRVATPKSGYQDFLQQVREVIDTLLRKETVVAIGIGCCGSLNRATGRMQGANILYLNNQDFLGDLQAVYALPMALTNDANCLAISEFCFGAAREAKDSCLAVILGTGCGGGVIVNGGLVDGAHGLGGEIGHNPLPGYEPTLDGDSVECYCGAKNCIEQFLSGTGFERRWASKYQPLAAKQIFSLYAQGDEDAVSHVEYYTDRLAAMLGSIVNIIDPEVIVLGGGISNQTVIYPLTQKKLNHYVFNKNVTTPIVKATNGDASGVIGAAFLPVMKGMVKHPQHFTEMQAM